MTQDKTRQPPQPEKYQSSPWHPEQLPHIRKMTPGDERAIRQLPLLNIDSLLIPSPYILDKAIDIDYDHSFVWDEKGELLGYLLVYATPDRKKFHIYRQATSPFGRGKGVGTACVRYLAHTVDPEAHIYLYVWDKLISSIDFFRGKGFVIEEHIVYRKMKFLLMSVAAEKLRETTAAAVRREASIVEELARVRHDVKKSLKVLSDMAAMMSVDNFNKVAEDINRETTALLNTLNMYEDRTHLSHKVSLKELISERVIPYVEAVDGTCQVRLVIGGRIAPVAGSYIRLSRALINITANALDAIRAAGRPGLLEFSLEQQGDTVTLAITDNGVGIATDRLRKGPDLLPLFVGETTKGDMAGEGIGTKQIFATFGPEHVEVASIPGESTRWTIRMKVGDTRESALHADLFSKYVRFIKSTQKIGLNRESGRTEIAAFIWQLRQMELFSYNLIYHYSRYNNIRDIFQSTLLYRFGGKPFEFLKDELKKSRVENASICSWLLGITRRISRNETYLAQHADFDQFKDILFQSYGQATNQTMIFTMDPASGRFFTTDRKLAEHLDFVPYLGKGKDELLRGELIGDVRNTNSPIYLGVWHTRDLDDLRHKLALLRQGAEQLLRLGLAPEKRIAFYSTTYNSCEREIDTLQTIPIGELAHLADEELMRLTRAADNEMGNIIFAS